MKKKTIIILLITISLFTLIGCSKKDDDNNIELVSKIKIGKKQYIEQLKNIPIDGTNDYVIITEKTRWEVPKHEEDTTVSFTIAVPYTLHVDGVDYSGKYFLGDFQEPANDGNPKYDFEITNLTNNYETEVLIKKK